MYNLVKLIYDEKNNEEESNETLIKLMLLSELNLNGFENISKLYEIFSKQCEKNKENNLCKFYIEIKRLFLHYSDDLGENNLKYLCKNFESLFLEYKINFYDFIPILQLFYQTKLNFVSFFLTEICLNYFKFIDKDCNEINETITFFCFSLEFFINEEYLNVKYQENSIKSINRIIFSSLKSLMKFKIDSKVYFLFQQKTLKYCVFLSFTIKNYLISFELLEKLIGIFAKGNTTILKDLYYLQLLNSMFLGNKDKCFELWSIFSNLEKDKNDFFFLILSFKLANKFENNNEEKLNELLTNLIKSPNLNLEILLEEILLCTEKEENLFTRIFVMYLSNNLAEFHEFVSNQLKNNDESITKVLTFCIQKKIKQKSDLKQEYSEIINKNLSELLNIGNLFIKSFNIFLIIFKNEKEKISEEIYKEIPFELWMKINNFYFIQSFFWNIAY